MVLRKNNFLKILFILFLSAVFLIPLERIGSFEVGGLSIRISQLLIVFIFIFYFFYSLYTKEFKVIVSKPLLFYILFLCSVLASLFFAKEKMRGLMILFFLIFMILVPYITVWLVDSRKKLEKVIRFLLLSAGIFSLFGILQFGGDILGLPMSITGLSSRYAKDVLGFPRIQSTFIEPLYFANYLMIPLFLSVFLLIKKISPKKNIYLVPYFIFILFIIILTVSKGALLATAVCFLGVVGFQIRSVFSRKNLPYFLGIILFLAIVFGGTFSFFKQNADFDKYYKKAYSIITGASISEREEAYKIAWEAFNKNPVLGIGIGGFGPYFSGYPTSAPDFGWPIANNQYLEILSETGLVGFSLFMLFIFSIFYYSFLAYKKTNDSFLKTVLLGLNLAFFGVLIQYMTFSTLYIMHIWFLIGLILAVQEIAVSDSNKIINNP